MNKKNHYFSGLILITIGVLFLLGNLGLINWSIFSALYYLWPLILVALGINIIFKNNVAVKMITFIILILAFVFFGMTSNTLKTRWNWDYNIDFGNSIESVEYREKIDKNTKKGELNLSLGVGDIKIESIDDYMYFAEIPDKITNANISYTPNRKKAVIDINNRDKFVLYPSFFEKDNHNYNIGLNEDMKWDIDIEIGAADAEFDFTNIIVENMNMEAGASDIDIELGDNTDLSSISLTMGAGDLTIDLPDSVGVKAEISGGINDINFDGGDWKKSDDKYISSNYDEADSKVHLEIEMGVGDIKINYQ